MKRKEGSLGPDEGERGRGRKGGREGGNEACVPEGNVEEGAEAVDEVEGEQLELQRRLILLRGTMTFPVV